MKNSIFSHCFSTRKAEDYQYMNIVNDDFSVQYKEILKTEFGNLVPTQNITTTDTVIFNLVIQVETLILFEDSVPSKGY